jgi:hypothetical protein
MTVGEMPQVGRKVSASVGEYGRKVPTDAHYIADMHVVEVSIPMHACIHSKRTHTPPSAASKPMLTLKR